MIHRPAARKAPADLIFHVLNRGVGRREIFAKDEDYVAFERVMTHALDRDRTRRRSQSPPLPLAIWPVPQPTDWLTWVSEPQTVTELEALRASIDKGKPFGDKTW